MHLSIEDQKQKKQMGPVKQKKRWDLFVEGGDELERKGKNKVKHTADQQQRPALWE